MKLLIIGINGFLGSEMAQFFGARGHAVCGSARRVEDARRLPRLQNSEVFPFSLGDTPQPSWFAGVDAVIHSAHDFTPGSLPLNAGATKALFASARDAGVRRQVYLSSFSSRPDALSEYGRTKYLLEQFFLEEGETVLRPGLVIGHGGLFFRNVQSVRCTPVVPLLNGGRDLIPVIAISDLLAAVEVILEQRGSGAYNLFHPELITMRRLLDTVKRRAGRKSLYLPINAGVALVALTALRKIGLRLPVDVDNLRALRQNQASLHRSDLPGLLPEFTGPEEAISRVVASPRC